MKGCMILYYNWDNYIYANNAPKYFTYFFSYIYFPWLWVKICIHFKLENILLERTLIFYVLSKLGWHVYYCIKSWNVQLYISIIILTDSNIPSEEEDFSIFLIFLFYYNKSEYCHKKYDYSRLVGICNQIKKLTPKEGNSQNIPKSLYIHHNPLLHTHNNRKKVGLTTGILGKEEVVWFFLYMSWFSILYIKLFAYVKNIGSTSRVVV